MPAARRTNPHRGYRGYTDEWVTPRWVLERLGRFDLDPAGMSPRPWDCAQTTWTVDDDGYRRPWYGRVWLNPPYGPATWRWLAKLAAHGRGMALVFARTETKGFFDSVWSRASGLLFIRDRLAFYRPDGSLPDGGGNSGAPSVLVSYGEDDAAVLRGSKIPGAFVPSFELIRGDSCLVPRGAVRSVTRGVSVLGPRRAGQGGGG